MVTGKIDKIEQKREMTETEKKDCEPALDWGTKQESSEERAAKSINLCSAWRSTHLLDLSWDLLLLL